MPVLYVCQRFQTDVVSVNVSRREFLKTREGFAGPKAIFEIWSPLSGGEVFSPKTSAKWLVSFQKE